MKETLKQFYEEHPDHGLHQPLLETIVSDYALSIDGIHGVEHWHRVYKNALKLAKYYNIESNVFMIFALFHDSRRANDDIDPRHGSRGAKYAQQLRDDFSLLKTLSSSDFEILQYACSSHTKTDWEHPLASNLIANICWDADRLDIGRVGFVVDPSYLFTDYAKEIAISLYA